MSSDNSLAEDLAHRPANERATILSTLSDAEIEGLIWDWTFWARPKQLAPHWDWLVWLVLAGRGFGKTRTGAEMVRQWKDEVPIIHLIGPTSSDVRDVMVEGPAGIMRLLPPWDQAAYEPSKRKITFNSGAVALLFSADEPDRLRGPQCYKVWADEPAAWRYLETWDQMMFGMRLGLKPQVVATTTPRPIPLIRDLVSRDGQDVAVTRGSTKENRANLALAFFNTVIRKYEGTRLGRQELDAEILEDVEGALWNRDIIDRGRIRPEQVPHLVRIGIGVDPPASEGEGAAECGIIAAGIDERPRLAHGFLLNDYSTSGSPEKWAKAVVAAFHSELADIVIAEANNGGLMVKHTIHSVDPNIPVKLVHASRGKRTRAEPVSSIYEQLRIHHVGVHSMLEDQMCLSADTLILTSRGQIPIVSVTTKDSVMTRAGWKKVLWSGRTGIARTGTMRTASGLLLKATQEHPVLTESGFISFVDLRDGAKLVTCRAGLSERILSSWEGNFTATTMATIKAAAVEDESFSTGKSGSSITVPYREAGTFITETLIEATTSRQISKHLALRRTRLNTGHREHSQNRLACVAGSEERNGGRDNHAKQSVLPVGPDTTQQDSARCFARDLVVDVTTSSSGDTEPVYNLTVQDQPEFFANGILVHNCTWVPGETSPDRMDAAVWIFTELLIGIRRGVGQLAGGHAQS